LPSSTITSLCTSAFTILSITSNKVSAFVHLCTPSNHSFLCLFASFKLTSRLEYVFSAARFMTSNLA
jgi:hypothetical protein